jgi:hypothetical protein
VNAHFVQIFLLGGHMFFLRIFGTLFFATLLLGAPVDRLSVMKFHLNSIPTKLRPIPQAVV